MKNSLVKLFLILAVVSLFFLSLFSNVNAGSLNVKKDFVFIHENNFSVYNQDLSGDLKIRETGGTWQDSSLTADVGKTIEFKIDASTFRDYVLLNVVIALPSINEQPMFDFVELSASPIPGPLEGIFDGSNTDVFWIWYQVDSSWGEEMTFKAIMKKEGTGIVNLYVVGIIDLDEGIYDDVYDSVQVTGEGGCCFPAGTRITMADWSYKNIEDVKIGDRVLSYDADIGRFTSWKVRMLGDPVHHVCSINDGLIQATVDHPFFVEKKSGKTGWAAVDLEAAEKSVKLKGDGLSLEVGDSLYTSKGEWIGVFDIQFNSEPVQTYNILSFSGRHTYFANDILVFEEYPQRLWIDYYFGRVMNYMPLSLKNMFYRFFT